MATLHRPASLVRAGLPVYQAGIRVSSSTLNDHQVDAQGPDQAVLELRGW